ncbi:MAG: dTDP-4-dehydrorhamnose 3,5-epimerase family protein [Candidatus Buchananbacteria bacterium]|nr:dTDP-4-dehydrorhamnose 3,5-epimerase family protein [Candidatus Buchananbacteria bacterium]
MVKVLKTKLKGVLRISPGIFKDFRGEFLETYNEKFYKKNGIGVDFVQDDISISKKGVLRGIHGDAKTWKLISCLYGKLFFVVVNCAKNSKDFGKWQSFNLSDADKQQILIPPKYGNAYLALTEKVIFSYKQSAYYDSKGQFSYKWNDPRFNIKWPIKAPILSKRDKFGRYV